MYSWKTIILYHILIKFFKRKRRVIGREQFAVSSGVSSDVLVWKLVRFSCLKKQKRSSPNLCNVSESAVGERASVASRRWWCWRRHKPPWNGVIYQRHPLSTGFCISPLSSLCRVSLGLKKNSCCKKLTFKNIIKFLILGIKPHNLNLL